MRRLLALLCLAIIVLPAAAKTSCDEVKAKIEAKLEAKGVKAYTLTVIPAEEATELRVVGTCEAGKKKIVYKRGAAKV